MAATVQQSVNNRGVREVTISLSGGTVQSVPVDSLEDVTIQVVRSSGSSDTLAVTGNCGGANVAVTSTTQASGADTALTAVTAGVHTIRQKVAELTFTPSGSTDPFVIYIRGKERR